MKSTAFLVLTCLTAMNASASEPGDPPDLNAQLRDIARNYLKSQLVNPRPMMAPTQCFVPPTPVLYSQAKPKSAHGGKLFFLFAKDASPLRRKAEVKEQAAGQYLVKETWEAVAFDGTNRGPEGKHASGRFLSHTVQHEGKMLVAGDPLDLYIMLKQKERTETNDEGWIYAVLSRDGKTVRKAGRIQSCIDCHEDAKHDRILGDYATKSWLVVPSREKR